MRGWIEKARLQGTLKITRDPHCPSCGTQNACKSHKWVSEKWFGQYKEHFGEKTD